MKNYNNYFKDKKILITGHTGFKGTWLSLIMLELGSIVYGLSNDNKTLKKNYNLGIYKNKIKDINIDINDLNRVKKIIHKINPDHIFHLAAQSLVFKSYEEPLLTFKTNIIGTQNILESIKGLKKCSAVFITSDKCYENLEIKRGYSENDRLGGLDPYSASKASAEILIKSYYNSFFKHNEKIRIVTARAGNVIGGGDWNKNRLVPDCIKSWSKNESLILRNPESTRPWQHVLEPLRGYIELSKKINSNKKLSGQSYNFGPKINKAYTVVELIKEMSKHWEKVKWKIKKDKYNHYESKLLQLNCKKAKKDLNWSPILNFSQTCYLTIEWYKKYLNSDKKEIQLFFDQIQYYFKLTRNNNNEK
tara:strand:+ start:10012 stop:11097 length:1086 start_codon:yes stop_codon:yes gene_type:complete